MAIFNEIMTPRISRAIQKYFQFKGPQSVKAVAGDVSVNVTLFWGRETRFLEAWKYGCGVTQLGAGGAGNISQGQLRNPGGSNVIAVIEKILVSIGTADNVIFSANLSGTTDGNTAGSQIILDSRWNAIGAPPAGLSCSVSGKNNSAALFGTTFAAVNLAANVPFDFITTDIQEICLLPDSAIYVAPATANEVIRLSFLWRERFLEESERFL